MIQEDKSDAPDENNDPAVHKIPVHHPDISDQNETSNPPNENSDPTPHEITAHYSVVPETESPDEREQRKNEKEIERQAKKDELFLLFS